MVIPLVWYVWSHLSEVVLQPETLEPKQARNSLAYLPLPPVLDKPSVFVETFNDFHCSFVFYSWILWPELTLFPVYFGILEVTREKFPIPLIADAYQFKTF